MFEILIGSDKKYFVIFMLS